MNKIKINAYASLVIGLALFSACNEKAVTTQNASQDSFLTISDNNDVTVGFTLTNFWNPGPGNRGNGYYYVSSKNNHGHLLVTTINGSKSLLTYQTVDNSIEYRSQKLEIADFFGSTNKVKLKQNDEVGLSSDVEVDLNFPASLVVEPLSEISKTGNKTIKWKKLSSDEDLVCRISYNTLSNGTKTVRNFVVSGKDGEFSIPIELLNNCQINEKIDIQLGRWNETSFKSGVKGSIYAISYTQGKFKIVE